MKTKSLIFVLLALLVALSFTSSLASATVGPVNGHTLITEPADSTGLIVSQINAAKKTIAITIYELDNSTPIYGALLAAAQRKVAVDITFNYSSFSSSQQSSINTFITSLEQQSANIKCHLASNVYEVTHQKGIVIDGKEAFICSFNFTSNYFGGTRDFGIYSTNLLEVNEVKNVAAADFADPNTPTGTVYPSSKLTQKSLVWSDAAQGNSRAKETALINSAKTSIYMYQELVEDTGMINAICAALKNNPKLDVRIIAPTMVSDGKDSNLAGLQQIQAAGGKYYEVNSDNTAILYIHAKMILVDYGSMTNQCYIGSVNFSSTSLDKNRESGIILGNNDTPILQSVYNTFMSDWALQGNVPIGPGKSRDKIVTKIKAIL